MSVAPGPSVAQPTAPPLRPVPVSFAGRLERGGSRAALVLTVLLLAATFLLLSPPRGKTYPGARPWGPLSVLRPLTELMSLQGWVATARGTEIKDFALHLAGSGGLALLAVRLWPWRGRRLMGWPPGPWASAQLLLGAWVALAALSALWSGDRPAAYGQAALYGLALAWAVALAWTLEARDVPRVMAAVVVLSAVGGALCLWYYVERNPFHRPGFPLGNPATLGAAMIPGLLIVLCALGSTAREWLKRRTRPHWPVVGGAALALVPLTGCFLLTGSRSAMLGLAAGLVVVTLAYTGRRLRRVIVISAAAGLVAVAAALTTYSHHDVGLGRSATLRFRFYAWRYAAELWSQTWLTSIGGQGAGSYPRLAGQLSLNDRHLDPAAFPGDLVEHAHNEPFEVLAEIGLVGGVTFVGGWLATLLAGALLLRGPPGPTRWMHVALLAGVAALMTDALFSPGLRLAGLPAVFYTLLGTLWAAARGSGGAPPEETLARLIQESASAPRRPSGGARLAAVAALALAVAAGALALRNWCGALREQVAEEALARRDFAAAVTGFDFARDHLLDPVRQLINQSRAVDARLGLAGEALAALAPPPSTRPDLATRPDTATNDDEKPARLRRQAVERAREAYDAAEHLHQRAPTVLYSAMSAARAAELVAAALRPVEPAEAARWWGAAEHAWRVQRVWRPFDAETLLALLRFDAPLAEHVRLLRDALRSLDGRTEGGPAFDELRRSWAAALRRLAGRKGFEEALAQLQAAVGPASPETDLDSLIASLAPEVLRLAAHAEARRGNYSAAQQLAARAAELYGPMRPRFPTLQSVALWEQAEFTLRESPERALAAAELLRTASARLPLIQPQKYEEMVRPFRRRLAVALLAADRRSEAVAALADAQTGAADASRILADECVELAAADIRLPPQHRPPVERWLALGLQMQPDHLGAWTGRAWLSAAAGDPEATRAVLAEARRGGLSPEGRQHIIRVLCQEFPDQCGAFRGM